MVKDGFANTVRAVASIVSIILVSSGQCVHVRAAQIWKAHCTEALSAWTYAAKYWLAVSEHVGRAGNAVYWMLVIPGHVGSLLRECAGPAISGVRARVGPESAPQFQEFRGALARPSLDQIAAPSSRACKAC